MDTLLPGALMAGFHFIRPVILIGLPLVAILAYRLFRHKANEQSWSGVIDSTLLTALLDNPDNHKHGNRWRVIALTLAMSVAIISAAGPTWEKTEIPALKNDDALVIVADMTLSMHTQDVPPSRLVRMRYKLLELLKQRSDGLTALIAYSGDAHLVSPLTDDANTIAALVPVLSPEIMPKFGSDAPKAFALAEQLLADTGNNRRTIVWFTDDFVGTQTQAIRQSLQSARAALIVVGLGTRNGGPIPLPSGKFLKDPASDLPVTARFNDISMREFVSSVDGSYLPLQNDNSDIAYVSNQLNNSPGSTRRTDEAEPPGTTQLDEWDDVGIYLIPPLLVVTLYCFRRGVVLALLPMIMSQVPPLVYSPTLNAQPLDAATDDNAVTASSPASVKGLWQRLWQRKDQIGYRHFNNGDYAEAQQAFESTNWLGASHYADGDYKAAQHYYEQLSETPPSSSANAHYNRGHALAHQGMLDEAISAYDQALQLNPGFENAAAAKAIVQELQRQQNDKQNPSADSPQQSSDQNSDQNSDQSKDQNTETSNENSESGDNRNSPNDNPSSQDSSSTHEEENRADDSEQQNFSDSTGDESQSLDNDSNEQQKERLNEQEQTLHAANSSDEQSERGDKEAQSALTTDEQPLSDKQQAELEKWLRNIDNDPSGLLKRKFLYEQKQREREGDLVAPTEKAPLW